MSNAADLKALVEWALDKGLNVTALAAGDCRIELMPHMRSGAVTPMDRGVSSLYEAVAGDLVDDAFKRAHGNMDGNGDDLVPTVAG